jgi:hypothetical protein
VKSVIDLESLRREILEDGEEDYYGLYEIIWSLNTKYPDVDRQKKVESARNVFLPLVRDGRVSLFESIWASSDYKPLSQADALRELENDSAWSDPTEKPYLSYTTSPSAARAV